MQKWFMRIGGYIVNFMAICMGAWCIYVIVMAILNTIGVINVFILLFLMYSINIKCTKFIKSS